MNSITLSLPMPNSFSALPDSVSYATADNIANCFSESKIISASVAKIDMNIKGHQHTDIAYLIETETFSLKKPLMIKVWIDGGFYYAYNEELRILASGDSEEEAFRVLGAYIDHYMESYKSAKSLTLDAKAHYRKIQEYIGS